MKQILIAFIVITIAMLGCKKKDSAPPPTLPVVTSAALTNVNLTDSSVTAGGVIVSDGGASITSAGIVWSKTNNTPTITDSVVISTTSSSAFTLKVKGLTANTPFYVRAFAINSAGTGYGDVVLPGTVDTSKVRFTYNGQQVSYGVIVSPTTGKKWLDRNLGAKEVATAYNDYLAYGDLFQWGRPADGHQLVNWTSPTTGTPINGKTATLAASDTPGHGNFIVILNDPNNTYYDWRSDHNRNRWNANPQGACPAGWHVPTKDEWMAETSVNQSGAASSGGMQDRNTAFTLLRLVVNGWRGSDGAVSTSGNSGPGVGGTYWASTDVLNTPIEIRGNYFRFAAAYADPGDIQVKSAGCGVRCLKN